jgi:antitoxin ParD1/3/4
VEILGKRNPAMNVSLTPELEQLVHEKVQSGMYLSASEVVREALRLLKERDNLRELRTEGLRKDGGGGDDADSLVVFPDEVAVEEPSTARRRNSQ